MAYNDRLLKLKTRLNGPVSHRVTSYFEPELVDIVDAYGESVGLKRAGAIRRAVLIGLQADGVNVSR
mgnify:CR=1 FL=1